MSERRPLRVLLTNRVLAYRTGTELYVRDLALALLSRGQLPVVYSPLLGELAEELRAATVPVVDDLRRVAEPPDVIHGHHSLETLGALLAFPRLPAVAYCHGWIGWAEVPPRFPRVRRYVAVDHTCADRLTQESGIPPEQVRVLLNFVDLERFTPRRPLPARPGRALFFSNTAAEGDAHLAAVRAACAGAGVQLDLVGVKQGNSSKHPERLLPGYDLVFAKARAALEALCCGCAVVLCDVHGMGPLVRADNFAELRRLNFGRRALSRPVTAEGVAGEIARYDAGDAAAVRDLARASAGRAAVVDELLALYAEVIAEQRATVPDPDAEMRAVSEYLRGLAPRLWERDLLRGGMRRMLRLPLLGGLLRRRAARLPPVRGLPQLLRFSQDD